MKTAATMFGRPDAVKGMPDFPFGPDCAVLCRSGEYLKISDIFPVWRNLQPLKSVFTQGDNMSGDISYPEDFVDLLEIQWGVGFLSPGGPEEVLEILRGIDLRAKQVLDIGCGVAGPAMVIARNLHPEKITGTDIEPQLIARGNGNIQMAGLQDQIELQLVKPGPLPFADATFDLVFSKDALIHITDKEAFYREILRVLKPGGMFAASDWLAGEDADAQPDFNEWRALSARRFIMQTAVAARNSMQRAGFADVSSRDRNTWYAKAAMQEVRMMETEWRDIYLATKTEDEYRAAIALRLANAKAALCGALRPTHLFGTRAADPA